MRVDDKPILTEIFPEISDFVPEPDTAYIYGQSTEFRSKHISAWGLRAINVSFIDISQQTEDGFCIGDETQPILLRSGRALSEFWDRVSKKVIYLDITGLGHQVWAPLLQSAILARLHVNVVYVEPTEYRFSASPTEGEIFDLSERITGISPIAGFTILAEPQQDDVCFIPMLGFEGARLSHIIETVQPPGGKIIPIVGAPGFRPEYPFHAYLGNKFPLSSTHAWHNVRFATANCPFGAYYAIQQIADGFPGNLLKIAPIGTKPHALGAIMFAMFSRRDVEIVYDHPIRKRDRTEGTAKLLVYDVSTFANT